LRFSSTIRHLGLFRITIVGSWKTFAQNIAKASRQLDEGSSKCSQSTGFSTNSIKLGLLKQVTDHHFGLALQVSFERTLDAQIGSYDDRKHSLAYSGPDMPTFLLELEQTLVIEHDRLDDIEPGTGIDGDEDDDDDDDDDDADYNAEQYFDNDDSDDDHSEDYVPFYDGGGYYDLVQASIMN